MMPRSPSGWAIAGCTWLFFAGSCASPVPTLPVPLDANSESSRVATLVLQLQAEGIETREEAVADLGALGPDALPAIREAAAKSDNPETHERLKSVIAVLEPQDRLVRLVGRPRLITTQARQAPLNQVLADLAWQSGVTIASDELPGDHEVNLEVRNVPLWIAIDELCRAHGGIRPEWSADRVTIQSGPFRETPHVDWNVGPIQMGRFQISEVSSWKEDPRWSHSVMNARLLLAPGRRSFSFNLFLEQVEDDKGKTLFPWEKYYTCSSRLFWICQSSPAGSILLPMVETLGDVPTPGASSIRRLLGKVWIHFTEGTELDVSIVDPMGSPTAEARRDGTRLSILEWNRMGSRICFTVDVTRGMGRWGWFSDRYEPMEAFRLVNRSH